MRAVVFSTLLLLGAKCAPAADEALAYSLKWPTGVSMGKSALKVTQGASRVEFTLDASLPGIPVTGTFSSRSDAAGCTTEFAKKYEFGFRKSSERTTIDGAKARRETMEGGKSVADVGACAKDGLLFLQFLRTELMAGRKPAGGKLLFGAQYTVALEYPKSTNPAADTVKVNVKGPASQNSFEIDFLRDAARTPASVRVPLAMGKFVLELVR